MHIHNLLGLNQMLYKTGDEIVVIVNDNFGHSDLKVQRTLKLQVIGNDGYETTMNFLCYVPEYMNHPHSNKIDSNTLKRYKVDKKFLGEQGLTISCYEKVARHIPCAPGEKCDRCKEFVGGGIRTDNTNFYCRNCKENPWR